MTETQGKFDRTPLFILGFAIISSIVTIILYLQEYTKDPEEYWFMLYRDLFSVLWSGLAIAFFFRNAALFGLKTPVGKVWLLLGIGLTTWFIGDLVYSLLEIFALDSEYPSPADYSYLLGYPFLILGILLQISQIKSTMEAKFKGIILLFIVVFLILGSIFILYPLAILPTGSEFSSEEKFFSLYYPIGDFIIGTLIMILAYRFWGGEFSKSWFILCLGFVWSAVYDLVFSYRELYGFENLGIITDHFYNAFYMIFVIGAAHLYATVKNATA
jgi:hypothetical protein